MSQDNVLPELNDLGNGMVEVAHGAKFKIRIHYGQPSALPKSKLTSATDTTTFESITTPPPVPSGQPTTFNLIFSGVYCLECQPRRQASVNFETLSVNTADAFAQSWEIIFHPKYGTFQLRNGDKTFLGVFLGMVCDVPGAPTYNNHWELVHYVSGTTAGYKIKNKLLGEYLRIGWNNLIELVPDTNDAEIWDFEISGTVPP